MIKKILTHWTSAFITVAILALIGFSNPNFKEIIKLKSFDFLLASEEQTFSEDIVIVEIDEATLDAKGQYPFSRSHYAFLIEKLREAGAGVIVFPILFSEKDREDGDWVFKDYLTAGTVIAQLGTNDINKNGVPRGVAKIGDPLPYLFEWGGMLGPIPELGQSANGVGVVNTAPEIDGVVRRVPLLMRIGEDVYPSIAIEVIRVAVGDPSYQVKAGDAGIQAMRVPGFATIETDANARIWLRHDKVYHTMSMMDVENNLNDLLLFGKTVIVSPTAAGISNIIATPRGEQYSHYITASTLQTVLSGEQITRVDYLPLLELIASILVGIIIILLARFTPYWVIGVGLIVMYISLWHAASYFFFGKYSMLVDVSWAIITLTIVGFHSTFTRFILEFNLKQQIRKQFERYLDPRQVAILQKDPSKLKLGGEKREMSFLFMDIVGFTPISEYFKNNDDPEGLVLLINDYLDRMSKIVMKNGGTIDKYMGDCIMAFWNAPLDCENHAEMAVKTSMECAIETEELKKMYKEKGLPEINIGSGVNTGTCIVGNMGSEMRFDYSVIGDAVNLAARLEAQTRNYKNCTTLYSQYTKDALNTIESKELDKIKVKGKEELITIYEPC
jgi:adenylate cyclase|tara:strand:+ start:1614 stop:3458 length:1845 start_codon:yes stop_codon:yes gene_type:complete